jgi:Retrotransposon gag protein/Zinc knuckle
LFILVSIVFIFITDPTHTSRNLRSNTNSGDLLPHDIITYGLLPTRRAPAPSDLTSNTVDTPVNTMSAPSFVTTLQNAALKDLTKFTGDPSQKVTQFINSIEQLSTFAELTDQMLHSIAVIKLGGAAFNWYDNNKESLTTWSSLKSHLLERFKPSLSAAKTQLKDRKQQPGESLFMYYDDVIDLCKQVDRDMPLHMVVDYLQDGLREELKIHVKRHIKTLTTELTPAIFLKIARNEEELQQEISSAHQSSLVSPQPYFAHLTAATSTSATPHQTRIHTPNTSNMRPPHSSLYSPLSSSYLRPLMPPTQYQPCLICRRSNHRTIDCRFKQPAGCYKCGAPGHTVRKCPQVFQ